MKTKEQFEHDKEQTKGKIRRSKIEKRKVFKLMIILFCNRRD
jgi:hypothetical protein